MANAGRRRKQFRRVVCALCGTTKRLDKRHPWPPRFLGVGWHGATTTGTSSTTDASVTYVGTTPGLIIMEGAGSATRKARARRRGTSRKRRNGR